MASSVTIQPSTLDTYLGEFDPTTNKAALTTSYIRSRTGYRNRSLLKFDFSSAVPSGVIITSATLSLYITLGEINRTFTAYRLLRTDWVETEATWNQYKSGSPWGTAGALNTSTDITTTNTATVSAGTTNGWKQFNVTAQVQTALDSVAGVAHFLIADVGSNATGINYFNTREYTTDTTLRPKLYIEYTTWTAPNLKPRIDGAIKSMVSGSVRVDGALKTIDSMWARIDGALKKL